MAEYPFLDLKALHAAISDELGTAMTRVFDHCQFINGPEVKTFEYKWADYCHTGFSTAVSNGTTALHAILHNLGIKPGDEVICPSHTFFATPEAIKMTGATPMYAEILEDTMLMDPEHVKTLIRSRTKAIIPVHLYGNMCDMDALRAISSEKGLPLIEDAAQAHGATYKKKRAGSLGVAAAFSFFPGKNLGTFGDGGAVTTNDEILHRKIHKYVNHGRESKYEHSSFGTNYRMDTLKAAILLVKLRYLNEWNMRRREVAQRYIDILSEEPFCSYPVTLPVETPGATSAYHLFVIRVDDRDKVAEGLNKRGVQTGLHYPIPCHLQPAMGEFGPGPGALLKTEKVARTLLSLPMGPTMSADDAEAICNVLRVVLMDLGGRITEY